MAKAEFRVDEKPPKKDGANSMWNKDSEFNRIVALRRTALKAMREAEIHSPFNENVILRFDLFVPRSQLESVGDLDNFITGICDGLQAADPKAKLHSGFNRMGNEDIHPSVPLVLTNDSLVVEIVARKQPVSELSTTFYTVAVEAMPSS